MWLMPEVASVAEKKRNMAEVLLVGVLGPNRRSLSVQPYFHERGRDRSSPICRNVLCVHVNGVATLGQASKASQRQVGYRIGRRPRGRHGWVTGQG